MHGAGSVPRLKQRLKSYDLTTVDRRVFLIEGLATIVLGCVVWAILPDYPKSPRSYRWLTEREQQFIETRLSKNAPRSTEPAFKGNEILQSLLDVRTWAFTGCQMFVNLGGFGLTWYLPTVVTELGFTKLPRNQLLIIPPSAVAVFACVFGGFMLKKSYITRPLYIMLVHHPIILNLQSNEVKKLP